MLCVNSGQDSPTQHSCSLNCLRMTHCHSVHLVLKVSSSKKDNRNQHDEPATPAIYTQSLTPKPKQGRATCTCTCTRFIAASNTCTTKQLTTLLTYCFTNHFKQYCEGIFRNTGVNCFWIIHNSQQVLTTIQNLNATTKPKCFNSFDFFTLYTNIPHGSLKSNLCKLIRGF